MVVAMPEAAVQSIQTGAPVRISPGIPSTGYAGAGGPPRHGPPALQVSYGCADALDPPGGTPQNEPCW